MKLFRKLTALLTALAVTAALLPAVSFAASEPGKTYKLTESTATVHGRYTKEKHAGVDTLTFSHGAAGIGVNFTGSEFWINIPEVPTENGSVRKVGISVRVDSEYAMDANMLYIDRTGWICVASGLSNGNHHIEIRKQSRGFFGIMASDWVGISELGVAADKEVLTPDPVSDLRIECYGDSITNGDAVWWNNETGKDEAYTNGNWTGVLERLLDAEVLVTGNTGNGLCGWVMATGGNGEVENLLPPQNNWDKIDPNHGGGTWSHEGANAADVVIINLGTNDRVELGGGDLTDTMFEDEYIRFIKQIKTDCPDAIVIATIGAMGNLKGNNYEVDFDRIIGECNRWAGETFCFFHQLAKGNDIIGGLGWDNGHPSNLAGEIYGLQLATMIKKVLNLDVTLPTDVPVSAFTAKVNTGDLALLGTAFDSGCSLYEGHIASNINDGDKGTGWQTGSKSVVGDNVYVGVMLDKLSAANGATILWEEATRCEASTAGYRLEVTADGETWFVPDGISYEYNVTGSQDTITFDETSILGLRVVCLKGTNDKDYGPQIYTLEISAAEASIPDDIIKFCTGTTTTLSMVDDEILHARALAGGLPGDVDGDGEVDANDLTALARHVGQIELITDTARLACCDLDGKEGVTADDLTKLARIVGKIE